MNNPDHYHTMTDAQLAEWHQLATRVDKLTRDLATSRAATEQVQAHAAEREGQVRGRLVALQSEVLKLAQQRAELQTANRRLCAEQVQLIRALRGLVDAVSFIREAGQGEEAYAQLRVTYREALEVLKLVEVPF